MKKHFAAIKGVSVSPVSLALIRIVFAMLFENIVVNRLTIYSAAANGPQFIVSALLFVAGLCALFGWFSRAAVFVIGVACTLIYWRINYHWPDVGVDAFAFVEAASARREHIFLGYMGLLLAFTPCGNALSLDAVYRGKASGILTSRAVFLMQLLLVSVYFWAALSKLNAEFLSGYVFESMIIRFITGSYQFTHSAGTEMVFSLAAKLAVLLEFSIAAGLSFKPTRPYAIIVGLLMHLFVMLCAPILIFSIAISSVYLLFLEPRAVQNFAQRFFTVPRH